MRAGKDKTRRYKQNVVRGFSLVPHDPEGSHYRILEFPMRAEQLQESELLIASMSIYEQQLG